MRRSSDARSSPSTYSIDRKCRPSISPMSYTRHTLGCDTCRAMRTSLRKRASARGRSCAPRREELQRHRLAELEVVGAVHLAHAAAAEQAENPVAARQRGAGRKPAFFYRGDGGRRSARGTAMRRSGGIGWVGHYRSSAAFRNIDRPASDV